MLGTHGREGLKQVVLGSVAETIFRAAPCPVIVVGPKAPQAGRAAGLSRPAVCHRPQPRVAQGGTVRAGVAEENQADVIVLMSARKRSATSTSRIWPPNRWGSGCVN